MSDFGKALMWTAIPLAVLSVISLATVDVGSKIIGIFTIVCFVAAIVASIFFAIKGKRQIAAGILVGVSIGIVALGVTCFAVVVRELG